MRRELIDILACPVCKGNMELSVSEENDREVISGYLHCIRCNEDYPIVDTIPNLLPRDKHGQANS